MFLSEGMFGDDLLYQQRPVGLDEVLQGGVGRVDAAQLSVDPALLPGHEDTVPRRPLLLTLPSGKPQVK